MESTILQLISWSIFTSIVYSCLEIKFVSKIYGTFEFSQLPAKEYPSFNGRPIYFAQHHDLYLYHVVQDDEYGRWIVSVSLEDHDKAIAFIDSWSITPYLTSHVGSLPWTVYNNEEWITESSLRVECQQHDESIIFDPNPQQFHSLAGFYVLRNFNGNHTEFNNDNKNRPVYSFVNDYHPTSEQYMYLFWLNGKWMIGEEVGIDSCIAYLISDAISPQDIPSSQDWLFLHEMMSEIEKERRIEEKHNWRRGTMPSCLISNRKESYDNIYDTMRLYRSLKILHENDNNLITFPSSSSSPSPPPSPQHHHHHHHQLYYELRNHLLMPAMGLGTGGLHPEQTFDTIKLALKTGYRLLDLAREYKNEHIVPRVLEFLANTTSQYAVTQEIRNNITSIMKNNENQSISDIMNEVDNHHHHHYHHNISSTSFSQSTSPPLIQRKDVFLVTKVWPTELGFIATEKAIFDSLAALETNYIDLYLIHWPECNPKISWMHCHTIVDADGTWEGSWRALEKAYAEGRVGAIGVSNFNIHLLEKFAPMNCNSNSSSNSSDDDSDTSSNSDGNDSTSSSSSSTSSSSSNSNNNSKDPIAYNHLTRAKVLPHVVQNWAEPGNIDEAVYNWCQEKKSIYQTYASLRNLHQLSSFQSIVIKKNLNNFSIKYNRSIHVIALQLMIQKGLAVIPRTSNEKHMIENLEIMSPWKELLSDDEIDALWK